MKKLLLFSIPMSICNLRCHYCYLAQRDEHYQGLQPCMKYSPKEVATALAPKRLGGTALMNFCADGETLLVKHLDSYIEELVKEGHFAEIVTNMTITKELEKYFCWSQDLLRHVEFKCSFHYLELKRKKLLDTFAENVNKARQAGASISIEMTPSDELIPYIDEVKEFSLSHFGALPHLTIARNDKTPTIDMLTQLPLEEYIAVWSPFHSDFWEFKRQLFGIKRKEFCYAGMWSLYIDLTTGLCRQCYCGKAIGNAFEDLSKPLPQSPIGRCKIAHCYNGHALLSTGVIPELATPGYGSIRDRVCTDRTHWLSAELRSFFDTKLEDDNEKLSSCKRCAHIVINNYETLLNNGKRIIKNVMK